MDPESVNQGLQVRRSMGPHEFLLLSLALCLSPVFRLPDVLHNLGKKAARQIGDSSSSRWNPPMLGPLPTDFLRLTTAGGFTSQVNVDIYSPPALAPDSKSVAQPWILSLWEGVFVYPTNTSMQSSSTRVQIHGPRGRHNQGPRQNTVYILIKTFLIHCSITSIMTKIIDFIHH